MSKAWEAEVLFEDSKNPLSLKNGVANYRVKTVTAGEIVYVDAYPVWETNTGRNVKRLIRKAASSPAQRRLNQRNAQKKLEQKINQNFGAGDMMLTLTYSESPDEAQGVLKDIRNFHAKLKRMRKKLGLDELKFVYTIEETNGKLGKRFHVHEIINGQGLDRDEVEKLWTHGIVNSHRAQEKPEGLAGFANYISKGKETQKKGTAKRWSCSRNLTEPKETVADHKLSIRRAERIATETEAFGKEIFGKLYPNCSLLNIDVKRSDYVPGAYIRVRMRRKDTGGGEDCGKKAK